MTHPARGARPLLHFTAPANWLNDPNGIIFWKDRYHLFYQHNPHAPVWSRPHWGHATSTDLLRWTHHPIALHPDQFHDSAGCYSGSCVDDNGTPTILYTAVREDDFGSLIETVGLATSDDTLTTWIKHPEPVIDTPPPGFGATGFRDPFVWKHPDGTWRLILGSSHPDHGAVVLLYDSPDLRTWRHLGVLLTQHDIPDRRADAALWECPQLVRLDGSDVLLLSRHNGAPLDVIMITGHLRDATFEPTHSAVMDEGTSWYAPHCFTSADHRHLVFGWLREDPADTSQTDADWAGALSLPRELYLDPHGLAATKLAPELQTLRRPTLTPPRTDTADVLDLELLPTPTEVQIRFTADDHVPTAAALQATVTAVGDELHITLAWAHPAPTPTRVKRDSHSSHSTGEAYPSRDRSRDAPAVVQLHIIIDGTIVETFVDATRANAFRAHPWHRQFHRLRIKATGRTLQAARVSVQTLHTTPETGDQVSYDSSQPGIHRLGGPARIAADEAQSTA